METVSSLCDDGGDVSERPSKERVKRPGERLRAHQAGDPMGVDALLVELDVVGRWRAAHAAPLTRVAANLRYYVAEASGGFFVVGQRLKRMETIRDKLDREPQMVLSRMHDIAGARAVLAGEDAVDRVLGRLREQRRWELMPRTWDYVAHPKPDGYRAKHLVVRKDGVLIEVQLRTASQHAWAELVEQLDRDHGLQLKAGRAAPEVTAILRRASATFAQLEAGELDRTATLKRIGELLGELPKGRR
ncbi:MAG: RelA/SpoT domain-containing protein [Solirubrobacterales bacterium]|nr:RelA/SpoT domain-containing protein [Solirubrobacterales bacterium]